MWNKVFQKLSFNCQYLILYSAKWLQGKTSAYLADPEQFTKVLPIQIYVIKLQAD